MSEKRWGRFHYLPVLPLGEDGRLVTGSKEHIALSRNAAAEGMVLLKNDNSLLPLPEGARVALFGKGSADYVKGGGGSGDTVVAYVKNLCEAMEEKEKEGKVSIFAPLNAFYCANIKEQYANGVQPGKTEEPIIPNDLLEQATEYDVAVISICWFSSEANDRKGQLNDGEFYLSEVEKQMVEKVCERFEKVVVVLNIGGIMDTSWFANNPKISSVLLAWQGGMEGALAEADILCGDVTPSGKLVDTIAADLSDYPSSTGFFESNDYVNYTEDIYVGYRYFETIPNAREKVVYPFGFGLSYTDFRVRTVNVVEVNGEFRISVEVQNIGQYAGKEVIQVYSESPKNSFGTPYRELRAFKKTRLLQPKEKQILELSFKVNDMAVYNEYTATYILAKGAYSICIGTDIRNCETIYNFICKEDEIIKKVKNRCCARKLPCRLKADGTYEELNVCEYEPKDALSELPQGERWFAEYLLPNFRQVRVSEERKSFEKVASGEISLEEFIDCLTEDELITLVGGCHDRGVADTKGVGGLDYLGIPAVMTADGPAGLRVVKDRGIKTTAWPIATALACTWDENIVYDIGYAGACEVEENNFGMWLTPAINIHRNPLCGRNFEYYSEDPLLTGKMAAAMVRGIQSRNVSACVKHFCCNNKETNRMGSDSVVSERALREIYLKAFEIVINESNVWAVMTAYNKINGLYTSENRELIEGILREEWNYKGLVVSDWGNLAEHCREIVAGNNVKMPFGMPKRIRSALDKGLIAKDDLKKNVKYLLEFILKLN